MSTALKRISEQEYLLRERAADFKSEFFDGEMFAMVGGTPTHSLIAANFIREAGNALRGRPCKVFTSDLRVRVDATGLYTYPDATIVCGELQFADDQRDTLTNPTVIVEVLSESTEKYDRGRKANHYRQIESLQELVLISQDRPHIERFTRQSSGDWLFHEDRGLTAKFELPAVGILAQTGLAIALAEIYRNVEFAPLNESE